VAASRKDPETRSVSLALQRPRCWDSRPVHAPCGQPSFHPSARCPQLV